MAKSGYHILGIFHVAKFSQILLSHKIITMTHLYIAHVDHLQKYFSQKFSGIQYFKGKQTSKICMNFLH